MDIYLHTLTSIFVLALIILLIVVLRHFRFLKQEDGLLFSKLVTQVTLPAIIFYSLAHSTLQWKYVFLFLMMIGVSLFVIGLAWIVGRLLKLNPPQMGSFLLTSGFGSSALLGYALVAELFVNNRDALAEAAFISELGVGLPLFTLGVMIAIYYGNANNNASILSSATLFFKSPIFLSLAAGIIYSVLQFPVHGDFITPLFDAVHIIGKANTLMVALTVGVSLQFSALRPVALIALFVIIFKLILSPLLLSVFSQFIVLEHWQLQVLILEAAMPSAMLSVVLSNRYGCDSALASKLVFATLVASMFTAGTLMQLFS